MKALGKLDTPLLFALGVILVVVGGSRLLAFGLGKAGFASAHDAIVA